MDSPVGAIAVAQNALREMLANCYYWRTFRGQSLTVAQARAKIYYETMPLLDTIIDDPTFRPIAVINKLPGTRWEKIAGPNLLRPHGTFQIEFHDTPTTLSASDPWADVRTLENMVGLVAQSGDAAFPGLAELSNSGDYLEITALQEYGPDRVDPAVLPNVGDAWIHYLEVTWGPRA